MLTSGTSGAVLIQTVRTFKELEPWAGAWNRLAFQAPQRIPDLSYAWTVSHLEHQLDASESWFCLLALEGASLVGILPIVVTPRKRLGRTITHLRTPYNDQTASIDCLVQSGRDEEIIPLLLAELSKGEAKWFCLEMRRLPESSPIMGWIKKKRKGIRSVSTFDGWGCFVRVQGSLKEFEEKLKPKFRRNLRNTGHKFQTLKDVKVSLVAGKDLSEEDLHRFMEVESQSWKFEEGSALVQSESLISFYQALTGRLGELGWMEWQILEVEGKPLAVLMTFRINRSLVTQKICYDNRYASFSPGTYLLTKIFEQVFTAQEVDEVNFLTDYPWFYQWPVEKRAYHNLTIYPPRLFPLLGGYLGMKLRMKGREISAIRRMVDIGKGLFGRTRRKAT
jgi:CelD/BcsL family acetyltransferase involved in cellulose biosynthesis